MRLSFERLLAPLLQDVIPVTAGATTSFLPCDHSLRRFFVNGKVALFNLFRGDVSDVQFLTITRVHDGAITVAEVVSPVPPGDGYFLVPMLLGDIELKSDAALLTDEFVQASITFNEVYGASALRAIATGDPGGFPLHEGLPVFNIKPNWIDGNAVGIERVGRQYSQGRGQIVVPHAERGSFTQPVSLLLDNRKDAWDVIRFLETREGRLNAFWLVSGATLFTVTAQDSSSITVAIDPDTDIEDLQDFLSFIGLEQTDGTIVIQEVDTIIVNGSEWDINIVGSWPSHYTGFFSRATRAMLVRNRVDGFSEVWHTTDICEIGFDCIELLDERVIPTPDLSRATVLVNSTGSLIASALSPTIETV